MKLAATLLALGLAATTPLAAQYNHQDHSQGGNGARCTFCAPWVYAAGAALYRADEGLPNATSENWTALVRVVMEVGTPVRYLGFFSHLEFAPQDGGTPTITYGVQAWLLPRFRRFNLTGGVGLIHRRNGIGEVNPGAFEVRGWGHVGGEWQAPFHEIALYGEAGMAFDGETGPTYQLGIRHPIAPWRFHLF